MNQDIYTVLILLIIFILFYRIEYARHTKNLNSISKRIWVNGTRGKSSVTRLIAAGLRAGAKNVLAKTTGTSPRIIIDEKTEIPISRPGSANIREQMKIMAQARNHRFDVAVFECMALRPDLQATEAKKIIRPNIAIITNVRADHLDVMGPTINDIAKAFVNALPENCTLFTTEEKLPEKFNDILKKKNITVNIVKKNFVSDELLKKFSYIEHKENVALALSVCRALNIDTDTALNGMFRANPDPGVLRRYQLTHKNKKFTLINALAANDPDSTYHIWRMLEKDFAEINILINCRDDRIDRSFQMAELIPGKMSADHYILTGARTDVLVKKLSQTLSNKKIIDLGNKKPEIVKKEMFNKLKDRCLIFAMGNTVGYGEKLIKTLISPQEIC